jgi:type II secretory pathway pseudopilin PulG
MRQIAAALRVTRVGGFSLLELGVVLAIIAVLAGFLLNRLAFYQERAELAAVHQTLVALNGALSQQAAVLRVQHREAALPTLAAQNPIEWLATPPVNYLGEFYSPAEQDVPFGNWYFDRTDNNLVYLLNSGKSFRAVKHLRMRFKVKLLCLPQSSARPTGAPGVLQGVVLDQVIG